MSELPFVLLVEDDAANRGLASRILAACGLDHAIANDGHEALERIARHLPGLVLMDLSMPGLDGWETTRLIRKNPAWNGVRIVAVTAHAMTEDRERALASGFDDVLTKPYRPADLIDAIRRNIDPDAAALLAAPI